MDQNSGEKCYYCGKIADCGAICPQRKKDASRFDSIGREMYPFSLATISTIKPGDSKPTFLGFKRSFHLNEQIFPLDFEGKVTKLRELIKEKFKTL